MSRMDKIRWVIGILLLIAGLFFGRFVLVPAGEPQSVWVWCTVLETC